jgi:hypothetical protein
MKFSSMLVMLGFLTCGLTAAMAQVAGGSTKNTGNERPFTVEYYYKVRWGFHEEFIRLFKKNHYPILKKEIELGRLISVTAVTPRYHNTEEGRWDYRVTIVYKNAAAALDEFDEAALARQLYPDQDTFKREEQRRFEILLAHWDLPLKPLDLEK